MRGTFIGMRSSWGRGKTSLATMSDGTSNTMVFSEIAIGRGGEDIGVKTGIAQGGGAFREPYGQGLTLLTPLDCQAFRNGTTLKREGGIANASSFRGDKGYRWGDSRYQFSTFVAAVPPNGVSCYPDTDIWSMMAAGSYHTGGVNVGIGDGSVTFVSDTINNGRQELLLGRDRGATGGGNDFTGYSGPSTYGAWGALGSAAGGDQTSL